MRILTPILVITGHFVLCLLAWRLGFMEQRRPIVPGDPQTTFGGLFFTYWGTVFYFAWRRSDANWLFAFLNARGHAAIVSAVFLALGLIMLGVGFVGA